MYRTLEGSAENLHVYEGGHLNQFLYPISLLYIQANLLIQVEDRGEGAVEMVGGAMVTEAPHPGATSNRNHPERSRGPPLSPSGNSTICPNREEVRAFYSINEMSILDSQYSKTFYEIAMSELFLEIYLVPGASL